MALLKTRRWVTLTLIVIIFILSFIVFVLHYYEIFVPRQSPEDYLRDMQSRVEIFKPETDQRSKSVVLMFHGCGGVFNHQESWAKYLTEHGYYAVIVDSFKDRSLKPSRVCNGGSFRGYRRASDVVAALSIVKSKLDVISNTFLIGWSHGAWSVMEAISHINDVKPTGGITHLPSNINSTDITGAILFYPVCIEALDYSPKNGWNTERPPLFIFAENDKTVDNRACFKFIANNLPHHSKFIMPNVDHAFDYPDGLEKYKIFPDPLAREKSRGLVLNYFE